MAPRWSRTDTAVTVIGVVLAVAVTFPGYAPANRVYPLVLELPFSMFWIVLWIVLGAIALLLVYLRDQANASGTGDDVPNGEGGPGEKGEG